jgi:hypothetical protein
VSCAVDLRCGRAVCAACATPRVPTLPTADPRRWQPSHVSYSYFASTTNRDIPFNHLFTSPLCPSSSQRIISNRHFPRPTSLFDDAFIIFSFGLISPHWLVTFVHVHAACTHLNLVYLYQPIVIGEAFRLFVILLLLALPCLNSLTRCVITCPIWLNKPRQRGLEVFMNQSQPRFSTQTAAILTCSGFFLPH